MTDNVVDIDSSPAMRDARAGYRVLEPLHGFIYFDRGAATRYAQLGLTDAYEQYFASRAACMGAVGPGVVIATFFNFSPTVVRRAIPAAWTRVSPEQLLTARYDAAYETYRATFGDDDVSEANALLAQAVSAIAPLAAGRPLYGGLADLPEPTDPLRLLWHRISLLREWRGDGHVAALTAAGVDPCEVLHVHIATGGVNADILRLTRAWPDEEWAAARARLIARGELTEDAALTELGRANRQAVEDATDRLAAAPWDALGPQGSARLRELLRPYAGRILEASGLAAMIKR
jgi:hypothetical protein